MKKKFKFSFDNILLFACSTVLIFSFAIKYAIYFSNNNSTNYGWKKVASNPILGTSETGVLFDPSVIYENNRFIMYVSSRGNNSISIAESYDGYNWTKPSVVLSNVKGTWENIVNRATVLKVNKTYYMYYTGQNGDYSKIGLAKSKDGNNWERYSKNPILVPDEKIEGKNVMNPFVMYDSRDNLFKMWYSAGEQFEPDIINYATSKDGVNWTKLKDNPVLEKSSSGLDSYKVGGCWILQEEKKYIMYYIGYTSLLKAQILWAESENGINWKKHNEKPVIQSSFGMFDHDAVYKPSVIFDKKNKKYYLYYNGRRGVNEYIGLAVKEVKE